MGTPSGHTPGQDTAPLPALNGDSPGPFNLEIEQALLGLCLVDNKSLDRILRLRPAHFYEPFHERLYVRIAEMRGMGKEATPATLIDYFRGDDAIKVIGPEYLARLSAAATSPGAIEDYADTIIEHWRRRQVIDHCEGALARAHDFTDASALEIGEDLVDQLDQLHDDDIQISHPQLAYDLLEGTLERIEAARKDPSSALGYLTGLTGLDAIMGGLHKKDLIVIAGRPSMGKSTLAAALSKGVAIQNSELIGSLVFTLEMTNDDWMIRTATDMAFEPGSSIEYSSARRGNVSDDQMRKLYGGHAELREVPLYIDDQGGRSVASIRAEAVRTKRRLEQQDKTLGLIVVDQLSHVDMTRSAYAGRKVDEIGEVTAGLKRLAKQLDVPVILLHQLSRAVESRENKRPVLSDLRDSGSLEQDADVVLFVFREQYYLERSEPSRGSAAWDGWSMDMDRCRNKLEIIYPKQRMGPTGILHTFCDIGAGVIRDLDSNPLPRETF